MATTTDLVVARSIENGREFVHVDLGRQSHDFEIASDADLQIDLFHAGFSALEIRVVMADLAYLRTEGSQCVYTPVENLPRPCAGRTWACCEDERAAGRTDASKDVPAAVSNFFYGCVGVALGVAYTLGVVLWWRGM